jgi:Rrf2 family protein
MKISKRAQYGLRAMVYLAKKPKEIIPLNEISKKEKISLVFLEKIISDLEKAKLVKSKRGASGGYFLARSSKKISAGEIVRVLEDIVPVSCAGCQMARICSTKSVWNDVKDSLDSTLDSTKLSDLIK